MMDGLAQVVVKNTRQQSKGISLGQWFFTRGKFYLPRA